jgi:CheY-like chemotaxis protein
MKQPRLQILVIEDHESTNQVLVRMLHKAGYEVSSAKNGETALKALHFARFDVVISDIGLPDTNGWDLLKKLRAAQPDLKAIALTGYGYPNDMKRSTQVGYDMHITKPPDWGSIEAALKSLFPHLKESTNQAGPATGR